MNSKDIIELYENAARVTKCCATQRNAFRYWCSHNSKAPEQSLAFDTETTGISFGVPSMLHLGKTDIKVYNIKVFGISLAIPTKNRIVLVWARIGTDLFDETVKLLGIPGQKVAHNSRYDLRVCDVNNIKVSDEVHCSQTAARIFWDRRQRFSLQQLSEMICPELSDWEDAVKSESRKIKSRYTRSGHPKDYSNYSFIPDDIMSEYSMTDSFMCLIVHSMLQPRMQDVYQEVYTREMQILNIALEMEHHSLQYDCRKSLIEENKLQKQAAKLEQKLYKTAGGEFNIKSSPQVIKILLDLKIPPNLITNDDKLSVDKNLLEPIVDHKLWNNKKGLLFISTMLDIKSIYKSINSYLAPLRKRALYNNGKIYCNINTADTRTGRMAVKDPGLQTIPRIISKRKRKSPIRSCFVCKPGFWNYHFDFKQIEMIFYAALIGDRHLIDTYNAGRDIYTEIATYAVSKKDLNYIKKHLGNPRQQLKQLSLAIIYGAGVPGTTKILQMTKERSASLLYGYLDACPLVMKYREKCKHELYTKGYVEDFFGRRYHVEPNQAYKAPNAVVQGSCAQILKIALIQVRQYIRETLERNRTRIIMPIHDELILERLFKYLETEMLFMRNVVHAMQNIKQLTDRGIKMTIEVERTKTNWESKQELELIYD